MTTIGIEDVRRARGRIEGRVRRTPVKTSEALDAACGARLFFKCEGLQETGSFKARGASNAVLSLTDEEAANGVTTHSSGNHAAALSWAARGRGLSATVVMPRTATAFKVAAVERYGGTIVFCEPNHKAREEMAARLVAETGALLIHPYNDLRIMAGAGTAALEFLEEVPDLDAVVCPVGGGGLLAGTSIVAKALRPAIRVYAGEPMGAADASQSLALGVRTPVARPASIADGLLAFIGDLTFPVVQANVDRIATVADAEIEGAMRALRGALGIAVEPSAAVGYAALARGALPVAGMRVGVILSGGNVDPGGVGRYS